MNGWITGLGTIAALELRQRVRSVAWLVLLIVVFVIVAIVTLLLWFSLSTFGDDSVDNAAIYSSIVFFVLLVGTLVTPAVSGGAINAERDAGTLATTQVTLVSAGQIVLGKFLAAWTIALTFLAASLPFIVLAVAIGGVPITTLLTSLAVLVVELGVVAAIGVGLSGLQTRALFSVVTTYLVVAALSIGTLIAFGLGGLASQSEVRSVYIGYTYDQSVELDPDTGLPEDPDDITCLEPEVTTYQAPRFDRVWWFLAANPYIVLADASPTTFDENGNPEDLFGGIGLGIRGAQLPPDLEQTYDECANAKANWRLVQDDYETPEEVYAKTVPSWFVGIVIHLVLAGLALWGAVARTRTPSKHLPKGSRVA
ncbi:ABC transporter permease [Microcella alkalica]|uniref:ABC transporter permease n=1 Tax=Microcella alkalica TaxID=355930 RepID=UPI002948B7E4|nr:ABC transporter permease [Microcella alkalica]